MYILRKWKLHYLLVVLTTVPIVLLYFLTTSSTTTTQRLKRSTIASRDSWSVHQNGEVVDTAATTRAQILVKSVNSSINDSYHLISVPENGTSNSSNKSRGVEVSDTVIRMLNKSEALNRVYQLHQLNQEQRRDILQRSKWLRLSHNNDVAHPDDKIKPDEKAKPDEGWVVQTHDTDGKKQIQKKMCPLWPPELVGRLKVNADMDLSLVELTDSQKRLVKPGGRSGPQDCRPREKTAVIIPYRDRAEHLEILVHHLHAILQRQNIQYGIYVIELAYPTQFNRGLLANIGFLTASSGGAYTCFVIHDVDLIAVDDRNMYRCGRYPRHLVGSNTKYPRGLPYVSYFGGAAAFTARQYWTLNGFSNLYFGWGAEDDDLLRRLVDKGMHFTRPNIDIGAYVALNHKGDATNPENPNRMQLLKTAAERSKTDGVRDVQYTRISMEFRPLYTWVLVSVNEAKYTEKYKDFL